MPGRLDSLQDINRYLQTASQSCHAGKCHLRYYQRPAAVLVPGAWQSAKQLLVPEKEKGTNWRLYHSRYWGDSLLPVAPSSAWRLALEPNIVHWSGRLVGSGQAGLGNQQYPTAHMLGSI